MAELEDTVAAAARLLDLVRDSDVRRIRVAVDNVRIEVERQDGEIVERRPVPAAAGKPAEPQPQGVAVTAPLMGVFYQRPAPDQPPFVQVGQQVEAGEQVAIVEAMKMMNPVVADRPGVVLRVNVADGEVVEFEQALLELGPVGAGG
ncbi:biotin/lipoyl-containing protein [Nonomuraea angiospora]|uniref:acetyl-CoA carboxylase biotin carboxyl carrier protein n=1 Tax=Nonomuraea angiospora TaxID=46172 RepID=UPI003420B368